MKNYGLGKLIVGVVVFALIFAALSYFNTSNAIGSSLAVFAFPMYFLLNAPIINISSDRISLFSLNPFTKNINVDVVNVEKTIVDITEYKFRIILQMKDGSYKSAVAGRYYDMKPVYNALKETGVHIESDGVGTLDWVG